MPKPIQKEHHYSQQPCEQEWALGGTRADDWWSIDINVAFRKETAKWRTAALERPDDVRVAYEDEYHTIFKVRRSALRFPSLNPIIPPEISEKRRARLAALRDSAQDD